ncbi:leucyl/phenylalanyl-tRNA--protein transferase [Gaetbulibacter aestuarii]|uniref:Leucyl/phenylalanyl-tRNA--protein transferase n=1 Tax=Gaetbulibacter aestuarii TaxID=1502358 RepID=A0ABW7MX48_9FLAO
MRFLNDTIWFPPPQEATDDGLLAVGGDLSTARLKLAYQSGIFPWFEHETPILWWSPDPRFVLFPKELRVSKSMKKVLRNSEFKVTTNQAFDAVITHCATAERYDQHGTWITHDMIKAYNNLHKLGYAISVEVWKDDALVGGLYGIDMGNGIFSGESMFSKVSNASKAGFISFIQKSDYKLIDCQVYTKHLESLGAKPIPRSQFLTYL